jgi:O-glycosyl hydrolase
VAVRGEFQAAGPCKAGLVAAAFAKTVALGGPFQFVRGHCFFTMLFFAHRKSRLFLAFVLLAPRAAFCAGTASSDSSAQAVHHDRIEPGVVHQTFENFSASDAWSMQKVGAWSDANKNRLADLLFSTEKGIGLSCWRFNVGGGINNKTITNPWRTAETFEVAEGRYDWTRQANERWFLRAAKTRGVQQFVAFVNSPPGRMTRTGFTNSAADNASTTNLKPGFEKQYAQYLADILRHFRDNPDAAERINFTHVSPVNEPEWDWLGTKQEGNRAGNNDIKKILAALHERLLAGGLRTRILTPESGTLPDMVHRNKNVSDHFKADYGDYVDVLAGDPAIAPVLDKLLCYHAYQSDNLEKTLVPQREQLRKKLDQFPGWRVWESEYCVMQHGRDLGMDTALNVARLIHADLTIVDATAWQWWLAVSDGDFKDGLIFTDWKRPGDPETIIESKLLWALGNYSRFIRPGMQRVELKGDGHSLNGLLGSAWRDVRTRRLVLVYVNMGAAPEKVRPDIVGGTGGTFRPFVTSEQGNLAPGPQVRAADGFEIPARSVVTLAGSY